MISGSPDKIPRFPYYTHQAVVPDVNVNVNDVVGKAQTCSINVIRDFMIILCPAQILSAVGWLCAPDPDEQIRTS